MSEVAAIWQAERPRLLGLAYTVTGSWTDAEDVVSDGWLRLDRAEQEGRELDDVASWLTTVVSRLALDAATTAAKRRESYVGPWLPEAVLEDPRGNVINHEGADPEYRAVLGDEVDLVFVRLIQELSPVDRVILVLVDVAELAHAEVAGIVGTTPSATRQRLRRARRTLAHQPDDPQRSHVADRGTLDALAESLNNGDLEMLVEQLSEGCVLWTDSGGLSRAARNPIHGPEKVSRFLTGFIEKYGMPQLSVVVAVGGAVLRAVSTDMTRIITLEVTDGRITGMQIQQNAEKIRN
jgi:RNA polymerase sigma-70 factor (ECF subfamily)